jgi:hypothetical protein
MKYLLFMILIIFINSKSFGRFTDLAMNNFLIENDLLHNAPVYRYEKNLPTVSENRNLRRAEDQNLGIITNGPQPSSYQQMNVPSNYNQAPQPKNSQTSYSYTPQVTSYPNYSPTDYSFYPNKITYTSDMNVFNPLYSRVDNSQSDDRNRVIPGELIRNNNENSEARRVNSISISSEENSHSSLEKFQDVTNEVKSLKTELFGNPNENMDFYKRNRNAYDAKVLQRAGKIAKILEMEELLDFYSQNNKSVAKRESKEISNSNQKENKALNSNITIKQIPNNVNTEKNKVESEKKIETIPTSIPLAKESKEKVKEIKPLENKDSKNPPKETTAEIKK